MTFTQLVQTVLEHTNLTSPEATLRVGRSINRHYARVTARLNLEATRFVTRSATTTPMSQVVTFTEIEKIDRLLDVSVLGSVRPLNEISMHQMREMMPGSGGPTRYAIQATEAHSITVRLDNVSEAIYLLQADGRMTLGDLIGEEEPRFSASYHDILSDEVIGEEYLKKGNAQLAAVFALRASENLKHLIQDMAESATRDTQQNMDKFLVGGGGGGGGLFPHHVTHETGGSDPIGILDASVLTSGVMDNARLSIDVLRHTGGYPGGTANFLRADGSFSMPPGSGGGGAHALTHQPGGSDVLTALDAGILTTGLLADARLSANVLKVMGGFPGGAVNFLRADGTFVAPAEQVQNVTITNGLAFDDEFLTTLTATTHNLSDGGTPILNSIIKLQASAAQTLTGVVPPVVGGAYYVRFLINASAFIITLAHNNTGSTAGHRFTTSIAGDTTMLPGAVTSLVYDKGAALWRVAAAGGSGVRRIQNIDADYSYTALIEQVIPTSLPLYDTAKTEIVWLAPVAADGAGLLRRVRVIDANSIGVTFNAGSPTTYRTVIQLVEHA